MEIFKTINGYKDYQISNFGNIKSVKSGEEKLLIQEVIKRNHTNYKRVTLCLNGKTKRFQVHRLVAIHFIENKNNLPLVNHKDNNGENNHYENLEWCTHEENMKHSQRQGRLLNSQKKAGISAGIKSAERANAREEEMYGKKFGEWIVISKSNDNNTAKRKVICLCTLCNKEYSVDSASIRNGVSKNCNSCGKEKNTIDNKKKELAEYIGKEFENWKVIDFEVFRQNKNRKRIMSYLKCNCKNCINSTVITLERIKNNELNECVICKNKLELKG